jgi:hypothetical protein
MFTTVTTRTRCGGRTALLLPAGGGQPRRRSPPGVSSVLPPFCQRYATVLPTRLKRLCQLCQLFRYNFQKAFLTLS